MTGEEAQSIIIEKGFGFCLGKREKFTRVFLSPVSRARDLFAGDGKDVCLSRAMFFGCDRGDKESWRGALNCAAPGEVPRLPGKDSTNMEKEDGAERYRRLGVEPMNNKRNHIRIARC